MSIKISFVIGQLPVSDLEMLKQGHSVISKMILSPDDYLLFHYKNGDKIQVETNNGDRLWCMIDQLDVLQDDERVILIFNLSPQ